MGVFSSVKGMVYILIITGEEEMKLECNYGGKIN